MQILPIKNNNKLARNQKDTHEVPTLRRKFQRSSRFTRASNLKIKTLIVITLAIVMSNSFAGTYSLYKKTSEIGKYTLYGSVDDYFSDIHDLSITSNNSNCDEEYKTTTAAILINHIPIIIDSTCSKQRIKFEPKTSLEELILIQIISESSRIVVDARSFGKGSDVIFL